MKISMSRDERASYLANVLRIAQSDGNTISEETNVLRDILERIGGDDDDLSAAHRLLDAEGDAYSLLSVPSQRLANMEDMVTMALADGRLHPGESAPIEKLSEALRYSQTDMDMIVRRAESRLQALRRRAAKAPALPTPPPVPVSPPPVRSPASRYRQRTPPRVEPPVEPNAIAMPTAVPEPPAAAVPDDKRRAQPGACDIPAWKACKKARDASAAPVEYCFGHGSGRINLWGCRLARMDWSRGAEWLAMGSFRDDRTFVFDLASIAAVARERLEAARECPHFRPAYMEEALRAIPPRASLSERWAYRTVPPEAPHARRVRVRHVRHGAATHVDACVDALTPGDTRGAELIVRRAMRRAGGKDINLKLLFGEASV